MTPKFSPRFDVAEAMLDLYAERLQAVEAEIMALPRDERAVCMDKLRADARAEAERRAKADVAEQEAAHATEQASLREAFDGFLAEVTQAAAEAHAAHDRLASALGQSLGVVAQITDEAAAKQCAAALDRSALVAGLRSKVEALQPH